MTSYPDGSSKILRAQVKFFEKSDEQVGIYPIRAGTDAYEFLQKGFGVVVNNPTNSKQVTIKKMFMGYLDPDIYQDYLQPVYVFLGDNNFVSYVPAITSEYLSE
jgi:hypothetical protein